MVLPSFYATFGLLVATLIRKSVMNNEGFHVLGQTMQIGQLSTNVELGLHNEYATSTTNVSCGGFAVSEWKSMAMSQPHAIFLLLRSVNVLLTRRPTVISFHGSCVYISSVHYALLGASRLHLTKAEHETTLPEATCCLVYTLEVNRSDHELEHKRNAILSPWDGFDKVLADTLLLLSWNSTCVLYDDIHMLKLHQLINTLYAGGIRYILKEVPTDRRDTSHLLECLSFQTQQGPTFVGVFSTARVKIFLKQIENLYRDVQGVSVTTQWLILADGLSTGDLEGVPLLHIAVLENTMSYLQSGAKYRIRSNVGNLDRPSFRPTVEWNSTYGLTVRGDVFPNLRYLLNNITLVAGTKVWPPFITKDSSGRYQGFCVDLLETLAHRLNCRLVEPGDNEWGRIHRGRWTGLIGQLARKEVDTMVAAISIQQDRAEVVDFTYAFFYDYKTFMVRSETGYMEKHWAALIDPFHATSLLALVASVPVMAAILCVFERMGPVTEDMLTADFKPSQFQKFPHCLLYLYGALLSEGGEDTCRSVTGRTVIAFWWLFAIVVGGIYTGNLVASRTITGKKPTIDSIDDLLKSEDYRWGIEQGEYLTTMFPTSNIPEYRALWDGIEKFNKTDPTVFSKNYISQLEAVKQGKYAFFSDKSFLALEVTKDCKNLHLSTQEFLPMQFAMGFHQLSSLTSIFSKEIMAFHESGIIAAWKRRWLKTADCTSRQETVANTVVFYEVRGAFYVLSVSLAIATLVLISEFLMKKTRRRCRSQTLGRLRSGQHQTDKLDVPDICTAYIEKANTTTQRPNFIL